MIIYSTWRYEVDASQLADFGDAFRAGGILYESLRRIPGHIHTDLLNGTENPSCSNRLLSISFFTSMEALLRAKQSVEMQSVVRWLQQRTSHCYYLGVFSFLPTPEAGIPCAEIAEQSGTEFTLWEVQR